MQKEMTAYKQASLGPLQVQGARQEEGKLPVFHQHL